MRNRKRLLVLGMIAVLFSGLAAGFVLAQGTEDGEVGTSETASIGFLERLAGILGIGEGALLGAIEQARLAEIDEAFAAGRINEEQAEAMRSGIEARRAIREVVDEAIAEGRLTDEQAQLLRRRLDDGFGRIGSGLAGRSMNRLGENSDASGVGFMMRTPRGVVRGGVWSCEP